MQDRKVTTPTNTATTVEQPRIAPLQAALLELEQNMTAHEAAEHLVTLMELLCSELPYYDFQDDLKQELWFKTRTIRAFFNHIFLAKMKKEVANV